MNLDKLYISTIASDAYYVVQKYGLGIEIADFCTAWNMDDEFGETDRQLKRNLSGVKRCLLHAPFNELFPCAIDKKAKELAAFRYRQAIALAERYEATKVIIHGGYNPYIYYPEWYVKQSILFWKDFIKELPETVHIVLENTLEETPQLLLNIVKGIDDSRMRICLDVGHINAYSEIPVSEWIKCLKEFISHFHIHNNDGSSDLHSSLEKGNISMSELFELKGELCPKASYTLELLNAEASVQWMMKL